MSIPSMGGTGADTITLGAAANNASINLGGGNDTLTFGNFSNTATVGEYRADRRRHRQRQRHAVHAH